jgi:multisubunit Na+/H+ antiporter MnhC subunit
MQHSMSVRGVRLILTFGLLLSGIVLLVQRDYLAAIMSVSLGSGIWLSISDDPRSWYRRPVWQRMLAITLMLTGIALFIVQFMLDLAA